MAAAFFVAADRPAEYIDNPEIQVLDARMASPRQEDRNASGEYRAGHIPGAVFSDIETPSNHTSPLPHMMPRLETFAVTMCELGVNQDKHLVIYDDSNLLSVPCVWWILQTFGVGNIPILANGLADWKHDELILRKGDEDLPEGKFNMAFTSNTVMRITDVLLTSHEKTAQIVDARPATCLNDEVDKPRPGLKRGHMPGVLNVPWIELVRDGELKTTDKLDTILFSHGVNFDRLIVASCDFDVTAAVAMLAFTMLGVTDVILYDGAWSEWGVRNDLPVEPQL